mmetsp:Transcript_101169/g.264326  ORF Transcript_101169/g.264326 Transcript_101169/m.264326 type:complete len:261 (-) Transcript_101169:670-1452(-)
MPLKASMARRPFSISLRRMSLSCSGSFGSTCLPMKKSPASRLILSSKPLRVSQPPYNSTTATPANKGAMTPASSILLCASIVDTFWKMSPAKRKPESVAIQPTVASMQTRPCLSSASRHQYTGRAMVMFMGSKPFSPPTQPSSCSGYFRYGSATDILGSSVASACNAVALRVTRVPAGLRAHIEPPAHIGMSLMMKSMLGPHKPVSLIKAKGLMPKVPSCHSIPKIATMAKRPLLRSEVWRRWTSASSAPSSNSEPKPKS